MGRTSARLAAAAAAVAALAAAARAEQACGLCDRAVRLNSGLAACFLAHYAQYEDGAAGAVLVDLSGCSADRGVVEPLPAPAAKVEEPDLEFLVSRAQLACLKRKLEQPGLVLDPLAVIDLGDCP